MAEVPKNHIIHRELSPDVDEPTVQVAEIVADIEDEEHTELTTTYDHLDHILSYVFSNPPVPEAQVQITFSYEGYRITVEQDGNAQFVRVD